MTSSPQIVLSASRRTDIPAFYMQWFMDGIRAGQFEVVNPYNRRHFMVPATADRVHTIVFWSKNFGPFIEGGFGPELVRQGYHLFFNFTVNSQNRRLEPGVPALAKRLGQLEHLSRQYDPNSIVWRFDPICFYQAAAKPAGDNLSDFTTIADAAAAAGIRRCITSFMDHYPKITRRTAALKGFSFIDPPLAAKVDILLGLAAALKQRRIRLQTCCEREVLAALPPDSGIAAASCIPNDLLMTLFGGALSLRKDPGQRRRAGCGCMTSVDIGSYELHPCYHNCLFCYANPSHSLHPEWGDPQGSGQSRNEAKGDHITGPAQLDRMPETRDNAPEPSGMLKRPLGK